MKVSELRIGNLISWHGSDEVFTVVGINKELVFAQNERTGGEKPIGAWKPIPLTEEELLKFGFSKNQYGEWHKEGWSLWLDQYMSLCATACGEENYDVTLSKKIEFVHVLQNFYSDFKGEELTIK